MAPKYRPIIHIAVIRSMGYILQGIRNRWLFWRFKLIAKVIFLEKYYSIGPERFLHLVYNRILNPDFLGR